MSAAQLNDTRHISKLAKEYVAQLGCDVSVTKGAIVAEARYWWDLNSLLGDAGAKSRDDHRHHAVDAAVIACINRRFHAGAVSSMKTGEQTGRRIFLAPPYPGLRAELEEKLQSVIVSHAPQRKLYGGLHEDTGAAYIARHGGMVYRKAVDKDLNLSRIVDKTVKKLVCAHVEKYATKKEAFAPSNTVFHKDGKTPIKRVRVLRSKITEEKLAGNQFGVKDKSGKVFKWMVYGNTHHVEILREKKTGKITGEFVPMMLAAQHARGIGMPKQPMVKVNHGEGHEFLMALHINDTVRAVNEDGEQGFYRIQNFESLSNRFTLRLCTASTLEKEHEKIHFRINEKNFAKHKIQLHRVNAIGLLLDN